MNLVLGMRFEERTQHEISRAEKTNSRSQCRKSEKSTSGSLPSVKSLHGISKARSVTKLNVSYNNLAGNLSEELSKLVNLESLDVSHNKITRRSTLLAPEFGFADQFLGLPQ